MLSCMLPLGTYTATWAASRAANNCIGGLVVEYIVAIDVTRVRFPADAILYAWGYGVSLRYIHNP